MGLSATTRSETGKARRRKSASAAAGLAAAVAVVPLVGPASPAEGAATWSQNN